MIAPGCDLPVTVAATSACVSEVLTSYVAPTMVDAASVVGSPICSVVGSGIATIACCFVTSEGIP